ncbi:MAG: (Fe-S)-binding protein, partial [Candidatus Odinarchaeota archaeon]|nr:(Fe-S)-binding protein [Candidatus Odinarchaeota archaeon]
ELKIFIVKLYRIIHLLLFSLNFVKINGVISMHGKIGFFIGCTVAKMAREIYDSASKVLDSLNIKFEVFGEDICCGMPLILSGYEGEVKPIAKEVVDRFAKKKVSLIVTSCPACYRMFSEYYPKILNRNLPFEFYHFTQFVYKIAKERELNLKITPTMRVTYHDPCELGRYRQIYEEPRALLNMIQSLNLIELKLNRENSTCCGGGGLLKATFPQVAVEIAKEKIENEIVPLSVDAIITACPACYLNFKDGVRETETGIKVYNIEQILALALGGDDNE